MIFISINTDHDPPKCFAENKFQPKIANWTDQLPGLGKLRFKVSVQLYSGKIGRYSFRQNTKIIFRQNKKIILWHYTKIIIQAKYKDYIQAKDEDIHSGKIQRLHSGKIRR